MPVSANDARRETLSLGRLVQGGEGNTPRRAARSKLSIESTHVVRLACEPRQPVALRLRPDLRVSKPKRQFLSQGPHVSDDYHNQNGSKVCANLLLDPSERSLTWGDLSGQPGRSCPVFEELPVYRGLDICEHSINAASLHGMRLLLSVNRQFNRKIATSPLTMKSRLA